MPQRVGRPATMRIVNRTVVLRAIREHAPVSRAEIARLTSISPPTVSAIVGDLIREGLVDERELGASDVGRPPRALAFSERTFQVGCNLSTSHALEIGLVSLRHELLDTESIPYEDPHPDPLAMVDLVADYVQRSEAMGGKVRAIGVGAPGVTDVETGRIRWAPALGWRDVELAKLLRERFALPVVVDNDVNLGLVGEVHRGAAMQARNVVFMSFQDGVGGAILIDGRVYRGRGGAGEVGYLVTGPPGRADFRPFGFTERRLVDLLLDECVARGVAVPRDTLQTQALVKLLLDEEGRLTLSTETRGALAETISAALASVSALLDPDVIVLTGWIEHLGNAFLNRIDEALPRLVASTPPVRHSLLGPAAVIVGAAISADRVSMESAEVVGPA